MSMNDDGLVKGGRDAGDMKRVQYGNIFFQNRGNYFSSCPGAPSPTLPSLTFTSAVGNPLHT